MRADEAFKQRIKESCKQNKTFFSALCKKSGVNRNNVFKYDRGVNIKILKKLCDGLHTTLKMFYKSEIFNNIEF